MEHMGIGTSVLNRFPLGHRFLPRLAVARPRPIGTGNKPQLSHTPFGWEGPGDATARNPGNHWKRRKDLAKLRNIEHVDLMNLMMAL